VTLGMFLDDMLSRIRRKTSLRTGSRRGRKGTASAKQKNSESEAIGAETEKPADFVFDVPMRPWRLACDNSVNEVIRPVKKLHFLYLQTVPTSSPGFVI